MRVTLYFSKEELKIPSFHTVLQFKKAPFNIQIIIPTPNILFEFIFLEKGPCQFKKLLTYFEIGMVLAHIISQGPRLRA